MLQILGQNVLNALQLGSVYALIALGYTMVYGILTLINFAHGDIFMVGTYLALAAAVFLLPLGLPLPVVFVGALCFSMVLTALLGVTIERLAYRPLRQAPRVSAVITALGVGLFLENFTLGILGPEPRHFPPLIPLGTWELAGLTITPLQVSIILVAALLMVFLDFLVRRTLLGMAMRAISYNRPIVPLMGVPVDRVISLTFAIGSAIAAAGGLMYGLAYPVLDPYMGVRIGWWAFISAVVGGIGNIRGAMLGGFILGAVEIFTPVLLPSSTYRDFVAFSLLLLLLVFKPTGLLGRPVFERV
ncbi:MAG: branched-chain amino acid ABC transporter permease [Deltaproteobacteria bacterium]|nr:MAG: branched-chain amino acid ABC transporter permease [Deltaproteobacteria bacterium]